jgi:hypothetical protein
MGWLKERCVLESQTNFFPFKRSPKPGCVLDSRIYGVCIYIYIYIYIYIKKLTNLGNADFNGSHGKYINYVMFRWPPALIAHDCKRLAQTLHSSGSYWFKEKYPYTQD